MIYVQDYICREVTTQALQFGIRTSSPIVWVPVILSSRSDQNIVLQTVRTGNCNNFSTDPTKKLPVVLNSASYDIPFNPISN